MSDREHGLLWVLARRCRLTLFLLTETDDANAAAIEPANAEASAPHGFDRIPVFGDSAALDGGWSYTPITRWEYVPTVEPGCMCRHCAKASERMDHSACSASK